MPLRPVYIALGSNLNNPDAMLSRAIEELRACDALRNIRVSTLIWTDPVGPQEQPKYLNGVLAAESDWEPECLLSLLHAIETNLGRVREQTNHWGARVIDLDLLMVGDLVRDTESIKLPHPEMLNRQFVLEPLGYLAPNAVHPTSGRTISELQEYLTH